MAFWSLADTCRFCGNQNEDVKVDLVKTGLYEKLLQYLPLKFEMKDCLSKLACTECANFIHQTEKFVLNAQQIEKDMLERKRNISLELGNVIGTEEIRSLVNSAMTKVTKPKPESVNDILRKLNTTSLIIKRIGNKISPKAEVLEEEELIKNGTPVMKMKMEILDEEIENLPAEDFVQYNETDDEEPANFSTEKDYQNIQSLEVEELYSENELDHSNDEQMSLLVELDNPDSLKIMADENYSGKPKIKHRSSNSKGVVINLTDPCHYVCVTCKGKFSSFEELQNHIDQNVSCKKVNCTCEHCGKVCDNRRALYQHKQTHNPKPQLICDQCGKVYTNSFNLENHKSQVHGEEIEEFGYVYKCCDQTFPTRRELNDHIATHSKKLNLLCDTCGKSFTSHKALRSHNMSHLNIRPFSCDMCDKSFRTKLLLVQHSHIHTGVKVFNCDQCEKSFAKKESLKKHYKLHSSEPVTWSSTGEKIISLKAIEQLQQEQFIEYTELQKISDDVKYSEF
ncbi:zinc finger protein 287-like [Toxorhynchites rutilus septentrionalis]|uniref:zinc finger protein 287-like n=1 Tax=Toxorhynchites rutilus septentrionalis TaxID=329112 RepID=UPI0024785D90|nr:zinc finger protein 287-like [Toxorhynchites rutilus septentrionalis]